MKEWNHSPDERLNKIWKLLPFAAIIAVIFSAFSIYALRNSHLGPFVIIASVALVLLYAFLTALWFQSRKLRQTPVRIRKR